MSSIPKIIHFCFGMTPTDRPWGLANYVCIRSAIEQIRPEQANLYYEFEPSGVWWDLTIKLVKPIQLRAPTEIFGRQLRHPAHRSDVLRLEKLSEQGGIYLDADVFVHRSFDLLLNEDMVLGSEGYPVRFGTSNAVILSQPSSLFLQRWMHEYRTFRGDGQKYWNEHSVRIPSQLARSHPQEITLAHYKAFYWPLWTSRHLNWIFNTTKPCVFPETFATHLWEGKATRYLNGLTPGDVRKNDTNFHRWAKPYLEGLSDNFGEISNSLQWQSRIPQRREKLLLNILDSARIMKAALRSVLARLLANRLRSFRPFRQQ